MVLLKEKVFFKIKRKLLTKIVPKPNAQRTLTLIAKVIQSIANQQYIDKHKESYLGSLSDFVAKQIPMTRDFLKDISDVIEGQVQKRPLIPDKMKLQCLQVIQKSLMEATVVFKDKVSNNFFFSSI